MSAENCPKCGKGILTLPRYIAQGGSVYCNDSHPKGQHLHEQCDTCRYTKISPCADAKKDHPAEGGATPARGEGGIPVGDYLDGCAKAAERVLARWLVDGWDCQIAESVARAVLEAGRLSQCKEAVEAGRRSLAKALGDLAFPERAFIEAAFVNDSLIVLRAAESAVLGEPKTCSHQFGFNRAGESVCRLCDAPAPSGSEPTHA
jgi:hypothetical protein